MKTFRAAFVLLTLALVGFTGSKAQAVDIDFDSYAAVAYSPSTGSFGYAWNHRTRYLAERAALSECKGSDAKIVGWVKGGWLVLARGDNNCYGVGWTYGDGASNAEAKRLALAECAKQGTGGKIVVCVCSGNYAPDVRD